MFNAAAHHPHRRASGLAALGRHGDSMLVHMNPREVMGLQRLAMAHGGSLTINPHTGLPEAFSLGKILKGLVPMIAGFALAPFTGGLSAGWALAAQAGAGMAAGAATKALSGEANTLGSLLGDAAGGASGGSLGTSVAGAGNATGATLSAQQAAAVNLPQSAASSGMSQLGAGLKTLNPLSAGYQPGALTNFAGANKYALSGATTSALSGMTPDVKDFSSLAEQPAQYYNTDYHQKWNPETHTFEQGFTPGTWSSKYAGPGFTPTGPAQDPTNRKGPPGSYVNPYTGIGNFGDPYADTVGMREGGGVASLNTFAHGGTTLGGYSDGGRLLKGPGDGMSDSIPAHIVGDNPQPAALADGEFVVPADVVSHLGNGSTEAGSRKLYAMMDKVRQARTGRKKQAPQVKTDKFIPA